MKKLLHTIWGLGGGGVLATSSWFIYDAADPTLIRVYRDAWSPIQLTIKNSLTNSGTEKPYSGSSCFERFFGKIEIQNFNKTPPTGSTSSEPEAFKSLFDSSSDIYGCAVGKGTENNFYELVMMNNDVGFATWYDGSQKTFVLKKENSKWEIKTGVWATGTPTSSINQIKNKSNIGDWSWWFYMPKAQISSNMQNWYEVFKESTTAVYEKDKGWSSSNFTFSSGGQIPKFDKVTTLDDFCQEQSYVRKSWEQATNKEKLNVYCLVKSS